MYPTITILLVCCSFCISFGQTTLPDIFTKKLKCAALEFLEPTEARLKKVSTDANEIFPADAILKFKKEKIEIRIKVDLLANDLPYGNIPHIEAIRTASNVASNADDSVVVVHKIPKDQLGAFDADWGAVYFFKPKSFVADYDHCKQISLFKKGKALVTILYLFNDENIDLEQFGDLVGFVN